MARDGSPLHPHASRSRPTPPDRRGRLTVRHATRRAALTVSSPISEARLHERTSSSSSTPSAKTTSAAYGNDWISHPQGCDAFASQTHPIWRFREPFPRPCPHSRSPAPCTPASARSRTSVTTTTRATSPARLAGGRSRVGTGTPSPNCSWTPATAPPSSPTATTSSNPVKNFSPRLAASGSWIRGPGDRPLPLRSRPARPSRHPPPCARAPSRSASKARLLHPVPHQQPVSSRRGRLLPEPGYSTTPPAGSTTTTTPTASSSIVALHSTPRTLGAARQLPPPLRPLDDDVNTVTSSSRLLCPEILGRAHRARGQARSGQLRR